MRSLARRGYSAAAASTRASASAANARELADAMMVRTVWRHRPQSDPAPLIDATCLEVHAPLSTALATSWLVTPRHRHTNIGRPQLAERADWGRDPTPCEKIGKA